MLSKQPIANPPRRRRRFLSLSLSRKSKLIATIIILSLAIGLPIGVSAVQNIFTGFGQITDIQFQGQNIDKVVYQGTTIWERTYIMQTTTAANCPTNRLRATDARDNATYWIRKIGNLCWMETNLAYAGGGTNTYGDATPAITQGSAAGDTDFYTARYFIPSGSNRTIEPVNPSISTNGTGQYGYLYNYCAAMNSQPAACQITTASQPNQSINGGTPATQFNICPKGWRLPTSNSGGELESLATQLGWISSGLSTPILTNGLFMYSGEFTTTGFNSQGTSGRYWSSTANPDSASFAYYLNFNSYQLNPSTTYHKYLGFAIRCVAP